MARRPVTQSTDLVSIQDDPDTLGALRFTFAPRGVRHAQADGVTPRYIVSVQGHGDATKFEWIEHPAQEGKREELEGIARRRVTARHEWLERLRKLVAKVKAWADDLDWATRVVDKKMEDAEIGNYKAPGLLLQKETVRLFLEPVARAAPGTEGIVDLYLMPSYDDIASLYYSNSRWNVHYVFEGSRTPGDAREGEARPLTKATLRDVFDEMTAHAV